MNSTPPKSLLEMLREGPRTRAWLDRLRRVLHRKYVVLRQRAGGHAPFPDFEDAVSDFVADVLLPEDGAAVKALLLHARDDRDAAARLRIMFGRHLRRDRRSIRHNKWRALRRVLPDVAERKAFAPDTWGPPGIETPPPAEAEFRANLEAWAQGCGPVEIARGEQDATQLPVVLHDAEIRRLVLRLFQQAGRGFTEGQIFRVVALAGDLDHWERVYRVLEFLGDREAGADDREEPDEKTREPAPMSDADLETAARREAAALEPVQAFFIRFRLGVFGRPGDGAGCFRRIRLDFGLTRTAFYEGPFARLRGRLSRLRAEHPLLPLIVLDLVSGDNAAAPDEPGAPDAGPNSPIPPESRGTRRPRKKT